MSSITRREFLRVSTLAAAGMAVAACTPATTVAPTTPPKPVDTVAAKATEVPTEAPAKWPRGDVPREQTFMYAFGDGGNVGMANPMSTGFNHQEGFALLVEPVAYYSAHGDKTYMWLAESYKFNENATELTVTFRKGIEWSDGQPCTVKDLAYGMNKLKTVSGLNRGALCNTELESTEVIDDLNLKIKLNMTDWRFFFKMTYRFDQGEESAIVPEHIYKDVADADLLTYTNFDPEKGLPVVTSPYTLYRSEASVQQFDLRPTWWAVKTGLVPKMPDIVRFITVPATTDTMVAQQIINNELDCCLDIRPLVISSLLAQTDHVTCWTGKKPPFGYVDWWPISIYFANNNPPWDNPKLHWAVAYAVDQQAVNNVGYGGAGKATNIIFPEYPKLMSYVDSIKDILDKTDPMEVNLEKSAALMTEAGYTKNADGFWADKDGVVLPADLYGMVPLFADVSPVIAEQLRKAGFKCEHKAPTDVWAAGIDGRAPMVLLGHGGSVTDPYDTFHLYNKEGILPVGQQSPNWARWCPDDWDAVVKEMNNTAMDDPKMTELFHKGMEIFYRDLPDCPLVQWFHRIPHNQTYWVNWPDETNPYINSAPWHLTANLIMMNLKSAKKT